ncbi:MAG: zinc ribbon domain-containing protein [Bryobacteraceae bacterium]|nr:zinc ribbon domain-containing protein [Bryobacteraceae bacterium]
MVLNCTCGARLPEDARFCHKCGRPLFDEPPAEENREEPPAVEAAPPVPPVPPVTAPGPGADLRQISFRNAVAVRTAFFVASLALGASILIAMMGSMPIYLLALIVITPASGFVAVWRYLRRTGQHLSGWNGAKLGFLTGVFGFVFSTVLSTLSTLAVASRSNVLDQYREQLDKQGLPPETVEQMGKLLENPAAVGVFMLIGIAMSFVLQTLATSAGGALGAKVLEKEP